MKNNRWKKAGSFLLAACLIAALLLSNQISGVFAEKDGEQVATQQEQMGEATTQQGESEELNTEEQEENQQEKKTQETESTEEDDETGGDASGDVEEGSEADATENELREENKETLEPSLQNDNKDAEDLEVQNDDINVETENVQWAYTNANINVSGYGVDPGNITVQTGKNENLYTQDKNVIWDYSVTPLLVTDQTFTMQITDCGIMSDDKSLEVYSVIENEKLEKIQDIQISEGSVSFTAPRFGEYIAVSNVVTVDLAKKEVTINSESLKGKRQDGVAITVAFSDLSEKKYRIAQSDNTERVNNGVFFSTDVDYIATRTIILDGLNTNKSVSIPAEKKTVLVKLLLRNSNQIHHIYYGTGTHNKTKEDGTNNDNSRLTIDSYDKTGELYIPYKMQNRSEEVAYVLTTSGTDNIGSYWSIAGIGADGNCNNCTGLTIAGGKLRVLAQNANGATAIGGGGNGDAQLSITGGDITAICSSTGAAIGGGIGWINRGGNAEVTISGGTVYAENIGSYIRDGRSYGGVAIGSGSSMLMYGNAASINISGGDVTAYAHYGNGIGSGNSYQGTAAKATINISGNSTVTTNALGGGTSKENQGGSADITIADNAIVNCVKYSDIEEKWESSNENVLNAYGIGGGNSSGEAKGGSAVVNVSGGILNCNKGNIGGGDANGTGAGGDASIYVSGGTLNCASIGGGNSIEGAPGAVTSDTKSAGVVVTGGTLNTGTIGGGTNQEGKIGFATANISGGNIQGQFVLANTDEKKQCKFTMTGGTINNQNLGTNNYQKLQKNGGAVYLSDSKGEVKISGGTIKNSEAELGGAIYMTAGTFSLSGKGEIFDCKAKKGGAVYIGNGTATVSGGTIGTVIDNKTHPNKADEGAGIYMAGGDMDISGGSVRYNTATNGAGAYLADGNMTISGSASIEHNKADQNGAGTYLAGGNLIISGGQLAENTATANGGGAYLQAGSLIVTAGKISKNIATNGAGAYGADSTVRMFGGSFSENKASENGGGMYISSSTKAADVVIRSGELKNNTAGNDNSTSDVGNGGAIAVMSENSSTNADHVIIGLRKNHPNLDTTKRTYTEFTYTDDKDGEEHTHKDCPNIVGNSAVGNGGGIYMNSSASVLDIYCLIENDNNAQKDATGGSIMSEGGHVNIGDIGDDGKGNNTKDAVGNVLIKSPMLVKGGDVKIYGNTENPQFEDKILVNIKNNAGSFNDYRFTEIKDGERSYKIEYFENFQGSGIFTAMQYAQTEKITAMGNMYEHEGYKIVGWNTNADKTGKMYTTGDTIGNADDHTAWDGKENTEALTLYAIWEKISYTVEYNSNATKYQGTMNSQKFTYGEAQLLNPNAYKVTGKRFVNWNTEKNGTGITYQSDYNESKLSKKDGDTIPLYAQWVDCTHKGGDYPGSLSYTADNTTHTITETCDCGGYTATISISGADVYYDSKSHPATLQGVLLEETPKIVYTYKSNSASSYGSMPENTEEPVEVGYYKASITIKEKTVSVEYQIKSPADAATIDVAAKHGQSFKPFNGSRSCTAAQNDAFTVQYDVQGLNNGLNAGSEKVYKTAPVLTLSQSLPSGTTIIMQTDGNYWYNNQPSGTEITLDSFIKMGTNSEKFIYSTEDIKDAQNYRFIIDFSKVNKTAYLSVNQDLQVGLKYAYTNSSTGKIEDDKKKEEKATVTIGSAARFNISKNENEYVVTAPPDVTDTRWERKNLIGKVTVDETKSVNKQLPSDAKLTVFTTEDGGTRTATYQVNTKGEFIIPFNWTASQKMTFALGSEQEAESNKSYALTGTIYAGSKIDGNSQPVAVEENLEKQADIELTMPINTEPALKISGTDKVLSQSDSLNVDITYKNVDNCSINAIIQKKTVDEYKGEYYKKEITSQGNHGFTLQATEGAGSYRVWITVSNANGQTLLEVPYYFIIQ